MHSLIFGSIYSTQSFINILKGKGTVSPQIIFSLTYLKNKITESSSLFPTAPLNFDQVRLYKAIQANSYFRSILLCVESLVGYAFSVTSKSEMG